MATDADLLPEHGHGLAAGERPPCSGAGRNIRCASPLYFGVGASYDRLRCVPWMAAAEGECVMRSSPRPRSLVRAALWIVVGPYVVAGTLLAVVFGFALLAVIAQLVAALLRHAG